MAGKYQYRNKSRKVPRTKGRLYRSQEAKLIALNAAFEAARAGNAGLELALAADELEARALKPET